MNREKLEELLINGGIAVEPEAGGFTIDEILETFKDDENRLLSLLMSVSKLSEEFGSRRHHMDVYIKNYLTGYTESQTE